METRRVNKITNKDRKMPKKKMLLESNNWSYSTSNGTLKK